MEDRISHLKTLLEETDRRISVYKKESERRTMHDLSYAELGKKTVIKSEAVPPLLASENPVPLAMPLAKAAETSFPEQVPENTENNLPLSNDMPRFIRSSIRVEAQVPFAEQVLHLARAGFSTELIAKHLGVSSAEVELAMALAERNT
jgi:hypothetical protein